MKTLKQLKKELKSKAMLDGKELQLFLLEIISHLETLEDSTKEINQ